MPSHSSSNTSANTPERPGILYWIVGALAITTAVSWLQFSVSNVCCGDFDGYYHIKWSRILWEGLRHGHLPAFTWLPLTTLSASRYADQHFLYHLLLIPFTWFSDLRLGAKLGTVLFGSLAVFALYWLVLRYRIRYALIWLLALLGCSWLFYVRLSLTRASSLSIIFIVAGIFLLLERKYFWLAPAAFLYVWTYNLFVMLLILSAIWFVVVYRTEKRIELRPILWSSLGTIAGFVVHPYFPRNVKLFFEHLAAKSGAANSQAVVGMEWYSLPTWNFTNSALVACLATVVGLIAFGYLIALQYDRRRLAGPLLFLLFSSFLLVISLRSVRFIEYWPPFAVLFAAFTLNEIWSGRQETEGEHAAATGTTVSRTAPSWCIGLAGVLLLAGAIYNFHTARINMQASTKNADHYQAAAQWMMANIPAGTMIYDVNWSDFGKLFFYDTMHRYVSGLDPIYLLDVHPELGQLTERLSNHSEADPAGAIASLFSKVVPEGVSYIFVGDYPAAPPPEWFNYMMRTGRFAVVYHDSESVILQALNLSQAQAANEDVRHLDNPIQRKSLLPQVTRRFGGDIYATDEENMPGGPALVIHNKKATAEWATRLFQNDSNSISGEVLWQLGYNIYMVTDGKNNWAMEVKGNPKFRGAFTGQAQKQ